MAVDWDFISGPDIEGESAHVINKNGKKIATGYVPQLGSGFTIGSLDVGQHSGEDIRTMLQSYANKLDPDNPQGYGDIRSDLRKKLTPYTKEGGVGSMWGKYGSQEGYDTMAKTEEFSLEDMKYLTEAKRHQVTTTLSNFGSYKNDKGEIVRPWDELDDETQTVLMSNAWQWGTGKQDDNRNRFKELWEKRGNKAELGALLRKMGEKGYKHRRDTEADLVDPPSEESSYIDQWNREDNTFA